MHVPLKSFEVILPVRYFTRSYTVALLEAHVSISAYRIVLAGILSSGRLIHIGLIQSLQFHRFFFRQLPERRGCAAGRFESSLCLGSKSSILGLFSPFFDGRRL